MKKAPFYLMLALLPNSLKILILNKFLGCEIDRTASIGLSYLYAKKIKMGPNARIGHFNVIRGLELLELCDSATILTMNSITAASLDRSDQFKDEKDRFPALMMGAHSAIVKKHFFDCNNTIQIGAYSTIAGIGSAFFTHGINVHSNKQESAPIEIGKYCMVSACCVCLKGSKLPDASVLAANSTLHKTFTEPNGLYSGVPAQLVKKLDPEGVYFLRTTGYVD